MKGMPRLTRRSFEAPCTVEIEHSADSLHAHVEIEGDIEIEPGDQVLVHDAPTDVRYGSGLGPDWSETLS
jgi:hypothetical protein